jgi:hypothetical protein
MDWKLVSAFTAGAVLASGIVYVAVRPTDVATKPVVMQAAPLPPTPRIAVAPPAPAPIARVQPQVARVQPRVPRAPVREKPSPMPPPVRHERAVRQEPVTVARYEPPPVVPTPAPAPAAPPAPVPEPPIPVENVSLPAPAPAPVVEARVPHVVTLAAGMSLAVRIGETISSSRNQPGGSFLATLTQPLVIDGFIIAERGARVEGRVVEAAPAGRGRGASHLAVSVVRIATADGQNIRIRTDPYAKDGPSPAAMDAAKVGGGAAIGAVIGAIAGSGKGAGIGAGAGGAVGAGDVLLTHGKPVEIPVETRISFRVQDSVTITERLD